MFTINAQFNYLESSIMADLGVQSGFGTKKTLPIEAVINAQNYVSMLQVHSTKIERVETPPAEKSSRIDNIDGMITSLPYVALLLKTADCVPALYYDPIAQMIAVTHQGWRGTLANMAHVAIDKLVSYGCKVDNIRVALGPALQDCCNRLYDQRYQDFKQSFSEWFTDFTRVEGDDTFMSLSQLNVKQYVAVGIKRHHIDVDTHCTRCEKELFYSYDRGDYDVSDTKTRNWSFIMK